MRGLFKLRRYLCFPPRRQLCLKQMSFSPVNISYSVCNTNKSSGMLVNQTQNMVIIHGLFGSKKNFDTLAKLFNQTTGWQVISVDARNHGESEHSEDMSYQSMAGDVHNLMKKLGLERSLVMGHSMGGKIAMTLALLHPDVVRGLIVVDMVPGLSVTADTDFFPRMINKLKSIRFDSSQEMSIVTARKIASELMTEVVKDPRVRSFLLTNLVQRNGRIFWRLNLDAIDANYHSLMGFPILDGKTYNGKTIFIGGSNSDMISDRHRPIINKFFPNCNLVHLPGCGHWVHADDPQAFANTVVHFMHSLTSV